MIVCIIDYLQCTTLTALSFPASANGNIDEDSILEKETDLADDTVLMIGKILIGLRSVFQPHIVFILLSIVFLLVPTPLDLLKSVQPDKAKVDNAYIVEDTPFVVIPEPGIVTLKFSETLIGAISYTVIVMF